MKPFLRTLCLASSLLTLLPVSAGAAAGRPPLTDGRVNSLIVNGTTGYLGGKFDEVGENTGSSVVFNANTGASQTGWPYINGPVKTAISDGAGGFYIGGDFSEVGGLARHRLARLKADKSVDTAFNPNIGLSYTYTFSNDFTDAVITNPSTVLCLLLDGSTLYIGGTFQKVGSSERWSLAAVNASTGAVLAFDPYVRRDSSPDYDYPAAVQSMVLNGSSLYFGGDIRSVNRPPAGSTQLPVRLALAAVNKTTGTLTSWNVNGTTPVDGSQFIYYLLPRAMAVSGSNLFIGGASLSSSSSYLIGGQSRLSAMAKIDLATGALSSWNPSQHAGFDDIVNAFVIVGTTIYVGGTTEGDQTYNTLWSLNTVNAAPGTWNPAIDDGYGSQILHTMSLVGNTLYVAGEFKNADNVVRNLAAIDLATAQETTWKPDREFDTTFFNLIRNEGYQSIDAVSVSGSTLFAGGDFTVYNTTRVLNLAAFDATTGALTNWPANVRKESDSSYPNDSEVYVLKSLGPNIYVGGDFDLANSTIVAPPDMYTAPTLSGGTVHRNVVGFDAATGVALSTFAPNPDGAIHALTGAGGGTLYVGGDFATIAGASRIGLAAVDTVTGVATAWNPAPDDLVRALTTDGTHIYAGGYFGTVNNGAVTRHGLAAFDLDQGTATSWNPNVAVNTATGVLKIAISSSTLYAGGEFHGDKSVNGSLRRNYAAAFNLTNGAATSWDPDVDGPVDNIAASAGIVYLSGEFQNANVTRGPFPRRLLAAFNSTDGTATTFRPLVTNDQFRTGGIGALTIGNNRLFAGGTYGNFSSEPPANYNYDLDAGFNGPGTAAFALSPNDSAVLAPVITSATNAPSRVGVPFGYQITATHSPASYATQGLPAGLGLSTTTGKISGTPTKAGTYKVAIKATNTGGTGTATLSIVVKEAVPVITGDLNPPSRVSVPFGYQITATNTPASYATQGLPAGLGLNTHTGKISGTPTKAGTYHVTMKATNSGGTGTATLNLVVKAAAPAITSSLNPPSRQGVAFTYQITATNSPTSYGVAGLPGGLSVNQSTGKITGKPAKAGTYKVTIKATNSGGSGTATLTLVVKPPA